MGGASVMPGGGGIGPGGGEGLGGGFVTYEGQAHNQCELQVEPLDPQHLRIVPALLPARTACSTKLE